MRALYADMLRGNADCLPSTLIDEPSGLPGRPDRPELVEPRKLGRRSMQSPEGRAVLLHALAHIEFNAINLALDAVWRFGGMPAAFYTDWLKVAAEEAHHFSLLVARLAEFGHAYGDFPAHDGLWDMCERTRGDVLARMALVPRTLEARGLDASPPIRARLQQAGDHASAAILDVILRDEIGHVLIGNRWFRHLCEQAVSIHTPPTSALPSSITHRNYAVRSISRRAATPGSTRRNWPHWPVSRRARRLRIERFLGVPYRLRVFRSPPISL